MIRFFFNPIAFAFVLLISLPFFANAEVISGGTFSIVGGVTPISGDASLTGGSFVVNGIVAPLGAGGRFVIPPTTAAATAALQGGGVPSLFGVTSGAGAPQISSLFVVPTASGAIVSFDTNLPTSAKILFGAPGILSQSTTQQGPSTHHIFVITGLAPDSLFSLSAVVTSGGVTNSTVPVNFATLGISVVKAITAAFPAKNIPRAVSAPTPVQQPVGVKANSKGNVATSTLVTYTGVVQDFSGKFVQDALVTVYAASSETDSGTPVSFTSFIRTDANGRYIFEVPRGSYRLRVEKIGFQTASSSLIPGDASLVTINVVLMPTGSFSSAPASASTTTATTTKEFFISYQWILFFGALGVLILSLLLLLVRRIMHRTEEL